MHDHHTVDIHEADDDIGTDEVEHAGRPEVSWQAGSEISTVTGSSTMANHFTITRRTTYDSRSLARMKDLVKVLRTLRHNMLML